MLYSKSKQKKTNQNKIQSQLSTMTPIKSNFRQFDDDKSNIESTPKSQGQKNINSKH